MSGLSSQFTSAAILDRAESVNLRFRLKTLVARASGRGSKAPGMSSLDDAIPNGFLSATSLDDLAFARFFDESFSLSLACDGTRREFADELPAWVGGGGAGRNGDRTPRGGRDGRTGLPRGGRISERGRGRNVAVGTDAASSMTTNSEDPEPDG